MKHFGPCGMTARFETSDINVQVLLGYLHASSSWCSENSTCMQECYWITRTYVVPLLAIAIQLCNYLYIIIMYASVCMLLSQHIIMHNAQNQILIAKLHIAIATCMYSLLVVGSEHCAYIHVILCASQLSYILRHYSYVQLIKQLYSCSQQRSYICSCSLVTLLHACTMF